LITELGKISALQVLSYQSVIGYRQTSKSLPEIASELKVDALLEGAVLPSGDRFRITANLIQAAPERHLWAEHFEFKRRDILEVQAQVAREVATQVHVKLTPDEQRRLSGFRPIDPEVHEAYLLGRAYLYKAQTSTNWMRAKEYFQKAIEQDPGYGRAYASLAELWMQGRGSSTNNTRELRVNARQWAEKALQLDPMLAEAHTALARVSQQEWDWAAAEREYQRAIALNPSYAPARIRYAMYLYATERFEEAAAQAKRAQQLEPASPFINTWAAAAYLFAGRSEDGMTSLRKALELDPSHSDASIVLARTYAANGMYNQAIDELERALRFNERESLVVGALASEYARSGRREEAFTQLAKLKRMQAEPGYVAPFGMIWAYAGVGDNDAAFAWLERAYDEHRDRMVWLNVDPLLDPLRSDPRFDDLVRRTGLPTGITRLARANSIAFTHGGDQAKPK
jgi:Tfp pilus assembly protein PilF